MSRALTALSALALLACQGASTVGPHPLVIPGSSELRIGDSVAIDSSPYTLRLDSLISDSRCPPDVTCVWAGEVVVQATLKAAAGMGAPDHQIMLRGMTPAVAAGLSVRITAVAPAPAPHTESIPVEDYRFTVAIDRAP